MCEKRARKKLLCFPFFYIFWTAFVALTPKNCSVACRFRSENGHQLTPQFTQLFLFLRPWAAKRRWFFEMFISADSSHLPSSFYKWQMLSSWFFLPFFLSFGPLNLMLCILDCCYWWKHQTLVEYSSFPNNVLVRINVMVGKIVHV